MLNPTVRSGPTDSGASFSDVTPGHTSITRTLNRELSPEKQLSPDLEEIWNSLQRLYHFPSISWDAGLWETEETLAAA